MVVSSVGGHLDEVRSVVRELSDCEVIWVVNDALREERGISGRVYEIAHAKRDWRVLWNVLECWQIARRENPDVMLSAGAGPAVPAAVVCRLRGVPVVFVESIAQIDTPSVTGRVMYWLASKFFFQWEELAPRYPKGTFAGLLR